jgi:hypothetical protein
MAMGKHTITLGIKHLIFLTEAVRARVEWYKARMPAGSCEELAESEDGLGNDLMILESVLRDLESELARANESSRAIIERYRQQNPDASKK